MKKRPPPLPFLILCEGDAMEPSYFIKLIRIAQDLPDYPYTFDDPPALRPKNNSPLGLVNEAIRRQKEAKKDGSPFHEVWVVFDRDEHANLITAFQKAAKNDINIAFSSICFELWLILHYCTDKEAKEMDRKNICDDLKSAFNQIKRVGRLLNYDDYKNAITNAAALHKRYSKAVRREKPLYDPHYNPYTDVDVLVKKLLLK
jgi:hypothetical protein